MAIMLDTQGTSGLHRTLCCPAEAFAFRVKSRFPQLCGVCRLHEELFVWPSCSAHRTWVACMHAKEHQSSLDIGSPQAQLLSMDAETCCDSRKAA